MPAAGQHPDRLAQCHSITAAQGADDRLVRGADSAMVNADHRLAADRSDERHRATGGGKNCVPALGGKINTAMTWSKDNRRRIEAAAHRRGPNKRPAGGCRQLRNRHCRNWNGARAQADHTKEWRPEVSAKGSHMGSLWIRAQIVRPGANLWTRLDGLGRLWTTAARSLSSRHRQRAPPVRLA